MRSPHFMRAGALLLTLAGGYAFAAPIDTAPSLTWHHWPGNNHEYAVYRERLDWDQAKLFAESELVRNDAGPGGQFIGNATYLATSTSQAEEDFLIQTFGPEGPCWLGGFQDSNAPDFAEPAGGWHWISGEPWSWENWKPGEPNNLGGSENYVAWDLTGWNDQWTREDYAFSIIERVPEPATLAMMVLGGTSLLLRRR